MHCGNLLRGVWFSMAVAPVINQVVYRLVPIANQLVLVSAHASNGCGFDCAQGAPCALLGCLLTD